MAEQIYFSVFTTQGLALLTEAIQNGTNLGITSMAFGDGGGSLPTPDADVASLVNEVHRTSLNSLAPDPKNANWLRAEAIIASAIGGFNIRELGLYAGDVLVAYSNYPPTFKPNPADGTARIMTFRMVLQIDNVANFELVIDPDVVLATIQYVDNNFSPKFLESGRTQEDKNRDNINVKDFGVVGDGITDDTDAFFIAKAYFDNLGMPMRVTSGVKILLNRPVVFDIDYTGIVFEESVTAYSYQGLENMKQGLIFKEGSISQDESAVRVEGFGASFSNFMIYSPEHTGVSLDVRGYSGSYKNIRILGFNTSILMRSNQNGSEAIFNYFERVDCYSRFYGLVTNRTPLLESTLGAVNETTFVQCRFRGTVHALWLSKYETPQSYGFLFLNCIWQETPPIGEGFYDMVKLEGKNVRGITFIGGRFEASSPSSNRQQCRLDFAGASPTKSLIFVNGTYILSSIVINDPDQVVQGTGNVYSERARLNLLDTKEITTDEISSASSGLALNIASQTPDAKVKLTASSDFSRSELSTPYSTSVLTRSIRSFRFRHYNVWKRAEIIASILNNVATLYITTEDENLYAFSTQAFTPMFDNTKSLGGATKRWSEIFAGSGTITTSDERLKQQFTSISDAEKSAALMIKACICKYKLNDAVELKGDGARWHIGVKAQEVISIMQSHNLDPFEYGFICYDEWEAKEKVIDENGNTIEEAQEAGSRYSIRYDELNMFIQAAI